ncbi:MULTISPECIES: hypothetical protein [Klebsiella pneumoniae complex]|uniref:hypothetical protein n=1 Tax=Klebsiella pneumoniae complex TaxID=3390273 RepID=UPI000D7464E7|nr:MULTISPECIES: hypothetical protein [Klebsiella]EKU0405949.1 hypothetical protein [Klebsiella aerogenes]HBQ5776341.1 hypothetical protein [Klebsiella pneumoniae subsp. pneumoniae]MCI8258175.1 hypothetical protein [Klebsiella pneumoniae]PXK93969.1 hypothetical protein DMS44_15360 [Klebsiella variicola]HBQ5811143.1 hypothetical protein [Klebsiella pneumoniae subsp. pneumoniae]
MYPLNSFGYAFLSIIIMVLGIGLIIKAIKKPLVAVKMILLFAIPLITFWGTTFLLDRGLGYFEGDKDSRFILAVIGGGIMFFFSQRIIGKMLRFKYE